MHNTSAATDPVSQTAAGIPRLHANLQFTIHGQGNDLWYAVKTPDNRYLRMGRTEYLIASAFDAKRSAQDVAETIHQIDPGLNVSKDKVTGVAVWLAKSGMISSPTDHAVYAKPKYQTGLNPIYTKIPIFSGPTLARVGSWFVPLVNSRTFCLVVALWLFAAISVFANWDRFVAVSGKLFVHDSYVWWGIAWLVLKSAHELGHAVMAVKVGSQIRSGGISLIFLAPVPYVDLSDLWTIPNRLHRILCCSGGMLFELVLAAIAALVALSTEQPSLQYFCCAIATMGTVTTLAFNASPLIRFDGYYIFSDLINYPNLYTEAQNAAKQFVSKCLKPWQPAQHRMTFGLVMYGLACYQYRIVMMLSLAIGTVLALQGLGVALVAWGAYATLVGPQWKARVARLQSGQKPAAALSPPSSSFKGRIWGWALAALLVVMALGVPSPIQPSTPGYIALREPQVIRNESEGFLICVEIAEQSLIEKGQLIAVLANPELQLQRAVKCLEVEVERETIQLKRAQGNLAELQAREAKLQSLELQLAQLDTRVSGLEIRSPASGQLVQNEMHRSLGLFIKPGQALGIVIQPGAYEIMASACQHDIQRIRNHVGGNVDAIVDGAGRISGVLEKVEPRASDRLQSPLLAASYGGPIPVELKKDSHGEEELKLNQPRFDIRVRLSPDAGGQVAPGQLVWLRMPGQSSSLYGACCRWCEKKWEAIVLQAKS